MTVTNPLRPLAAGRGLFGIAAVVGAAPLCRAASIDANPRRLGLVIGAVDAASVAAALIAATPTTQRRVAAINASTDLAMAAMLGVMAMGRHGRARMVTGAAAVATFGGGMAWIRARRALA